ncbi:MAG: PQQ-binding-like beta-propeller repeat protein [Thermoleophilia bacterium]|nr:PQQ-binding-like beta-propeller repeat protein [Thermoleophilia bacterium]
MKRILIGAAVLVLALVGAAIAWYFHVQHEARDVKGSSTVEFVTTEAAPPPPHEPGIAWPTYGYDAERQRFARGISLAPPFRRLWTFRAQSLVEFPPVVGYGRLFFANNAGTVFAIGAKNGKRAWKFASHRCLAASPALDRHVVYETFMNAPPCNRKPSPSLTGQVIAFKVGTGNIVWRRTIGPSESSPLVAGASVFVGDWNGRVWALRRRTGKTRWVTKLRSQVKSGVAISGNRIYVGDYSGRLYALNATNGRIVWQAKVQPRFGSTGNFYATPALAYGRVYIGATDGKLYSYGAASGKLRWSQSTGGFVYSSAAVWRGRVYAGSYSHRFFCLNAATGSSIWQFKANGPISGSPTIIAGRVYFATLKGTTYALDARTGGPLWTYPDGKYSPVVADGERLYLTGYARLYGLAEKRAPVRRGPGLVPARVLARIVRRNHAVIAAHRYASAAAAGKHRGIQVCNVVLRKKHGASSQRFWRTVKAVRSGCHR